MIELSTRQRQRIVALLSLLHIAVIAASNYLVQLPFTLFGFNTTWGAFTFPFIFLLTDLTVRVFGPGAARRIVFHVMFPALVVSYVLSVLFTHGRFAGWVALTTLDVVVARIAVASFSAYLVGQLLDVTVFNRLRRMRQWWIAPATSTVLGNLSDTLVFFSIAFAGSRNAFMAQHWVELAAADYAFKILVSLGLFVPLYGALIGFIRKRLLTLTAERSDDALTARTLS